MTASLPLQTGVYWHESTNTDLFFVTLQKTEKDYSPTTRYLDYAISDRLFHWESQATTSVASPTGRRYLNQRSTGTNIALFVRPTKKDSNGRTMPYFCAGTATYVEHGDFMALLPESQGQLGQTVEGLLKWFKFGQL